MFKFFRKIRQGLIARSGPTSSTSRLRKYLLYASGEIVLVVIGILIALQINNWNVNKNNQQIIANSYKQLLLTLAQDTTDLDRVISVHLNSWEAVPLFLNQLTTRDTFDWEFRLGLRRVISIANYKPRLSTFEAVKLNNIELITNPKLLDQLLLVYEEATNELSLSENELNETLKNYFFPFLAKQAKVEGGNFQSFEFRSHSAFANDDEFLGNIRALHIAHTHIFDSAMKLNAEIKLLMQLLESEVHPKKKKEKTSLVKFSLPGQAEAKQVYLSGDFLDWKPEGLKMKWREGAWHAEIELLTEKIHYYRFSVDGEWIHDPNNTNRVRRGSGVYNSYLILPSKR